MMTDNKGVTATEYGLIAGLIAIVIMASLTLTGDGTKEAFCSVDQAISSAVSNDSDGDDSNSSSGTGSSSSGSVSNSKGYDSATVADLAAQGITASDLSKNNEGLDAFSLGTALDYLSSMLSANGQTITGVAGLYDMDGNAITDYSKAYGLFHNNLSGTIDAQTAGGTTTDSSGFTDFFELTTSTGQVYEVGNYTDPSYGTHSAYMNKETGFVGWTGL